MSKTISRNQALLTGIGFMIGSGIFFRADNIASSTYGNVLISLISWIFISTTLIFAGITVAAIASQKDIEGGFVGYIEYYCSMFWGQKVGKNLGFIIGWYQIVVYVPIMVAIVSITFSNYFFQLVGMDVSTKQQYTFAFFFVTLMFIWNGLSTKIGALISSSATVIKIIPLILIGIIGIIFGDFSNITTAPIASEVPSGANATLLVLFFAPMLSMAFAFDGWVSVGSLSKDMKNPKKDLPFVFVWSIVVAAAVYILYYLGITLLMPVDQIIQNGDSHVGIIANQIGINIFGGNGVFFEKFILFGVIVSVLGTANGIFMAGSRYTHKLSKDGLLIGSSFLKKETKFNTPFNSSIFIYIVTTVYIGLYLLQTQNLDSKIVIDDIPMALNSIFYLLLFYIAYILYTQKKTTFFKGVIASIIATIGQVFIVIAFFVSNSSATEYMILSFVIIGIGYVNLLYNKNKKFN